LLAQLNGFVFEPNTGRCVVSVTC